MPKLSVIDGPHTGEVFELTANRTLIGRDLNNGIRLPDGLVSRHHAEVVREGDAYKLRDLKSTNGTFVNELPVTETVLRHGDIVQMADVTLRYDAELPKAVGLNTPVFKQPAPPAAPAPKPAPPAKIEPAAPPPAPPKPPEPVREIPPAPVVAKPPAPAVATPPPAPKQPGALGGLFRKSPPPLAEPKMDPVVAPTPAPAKVPKEISIQPTPKAAPAAMTPPVPKERVLIRPSPALSQPPPAAPAAPVLPPRRARWKIILFATLTLAGVGLFVASFQFPANALRFFGIVLTLVGALNLCHDWSPLPPKPKI